MKGTCNTENNGPLKNTYNGEKILTPLLDTINYPIHMKNLILKINKPSYMIFKIFFEPQITNFQGMR